MALPRVLEPEVMDTAEEASDYDAMDHGAVNVAFCDDFLAVGAGLTRLLDVGTGPGLIPVELCRRAPRVAVEAIDLAHHMLALAERNVARAGLSGRVHVSLRDAKATGWEPASFDAVLSNSIIHHIPEPGGALAGMWELVRPGGVLFVRDLERPASDARVAELVERYAPVAAQGDPAELAMASRQRDLLEASLRAALTLDEVQALVARLGIAPGDVTRTSDRHWTLSSRKP